MKINEDKKTVLIRAIKDALADVHTTGGVQFVITNELAELLTAKVLRAIARLK